MRDVIFQEIRECNRTMELIASQEERNKEVKKLVDIVKKMLELKTLAEQGFFVLEEAIPGLASIYNGKYLQDMLTLVVEGTAPDIVEELSLSKYFAENLSGGDGLHYLAMMIGCLAIQSNEVYRLTEERLLSLMSEVVVEAYRLQ